MCHNASATLVRSWASLSAFVVSDRRMHIMLHIYIIIYIYIWYSVASPPPLSPPNGHGSAKYPPPCGCGPVVGLWWFRVGLEWFRVYLGCI